MRIELTGHRSDPEATWQRLGDTDFMNRMAEGGAVSYELEPTEGAPRIKGVMAGPGGLPMAFEETYNGWVRGRWFRQDRVYVGGPLSESRFRLELRPEEDGVVPHIELELIPRMRLFTPAVALRGRVIRARWQEVLDGLPAPGEATDAVTRDLAAPVRTALERWAPKAPALLAEAMQRLLATGRDLELRELRAYQLADRLGLDRRATLEACLEGVSEGLLEVYWSVRCTRCQGEVGAATTLSNLADHASCPSCGIEVEADLSQTVEVLFAPHPSVFPRETERFCTLYPSGAPTLVAAIPLESGETVDQAVQVGPGEHLALGIGRGLEDLEVVVDPDGSHELSWEPEITGEAHIGAGELHVEATNTSETRQRLVLRDADAERAVVLAADVATVPLFRRQLGTEVLSSTIRVGSRRVALLFTDLSGSTALYEAVGDAVAYGLVRDHFGLVRQRVEDHAGEVVKTIGDAVMASFERSDDALRAAFAMREAFDRWMADAHPDHEVRLNVGVHVGMALGVHTDDLGLDWFGRNVNLAARAQGAAKDGELVVTEAVAVDPLAQEVWRGAGEPEPFEAVLKGIGATQLYRWGR